MADAELTHAWDVPVLTVAQFARKIANHLQENGRVCFFLGAGCSISSGVPGGGALARRWLDELHHEEATNDDLATWAQSEGFDHQDPGASYSILMQRRFPTMQARQREIERVTQGNDPGFAYATLAQLMTHREVGDRCSLVVTTNFDDLVADALYLYTKQKPLVVTHQALAEFAQPSATRPTVLKLHGDALFEPLNTAEEIVKLADPLKSAFADLARDRTMIFIGYSGRDQGVLDALFGFTHAIESVLWVGSAPPPTEFRHWLDRAQAVSWVMHRDFDELMVLLRQSLGIAHPDLKQRFQRLEATYYGTFQKLSSGTSSSVEIRTAIDEVSTDFNDWFSVELAAQQSLTSEQKARTYEQGLAQFPRSPELLRSYARLLADTVDGLDRADSLYQSALELEPLDPDLIRGYAVFLAYRRGDLDRAEAVFTSAIAGPGARDPSLLGSYAVFLTEKRERFDEAELFFKRALDEEPLHELNLTNYAAFLAYRRGDHDRARQVWKAVSEAGLPEPAIRQQSID